MKPNDLLAKVRVASPCRARWEDMAGDERSRFCGQCRKHVYNFSSMSAVEVADLIRANEGGLCGRFYRRGDGRMLTRNCPVGARAAFVRVRTLVAAAAALLLAGLGGLALNRDAVRMRERGPFAEKCDDMLWTVKAWLGLNRAMVMGDICVSPTPATTVGTGATNISTQNPDQNSNP